MYVCMYVCTYVCMYVCIYVCMYEVYRYVNVCFHARGLSAERWQCSYCTRGGTVSFHRYERNSKAALMFPRKCSRICKYYTALLLLLGYDTTYYGPYSQEATPTQTRTRQVERAWPIGDTTRTRTGIHTLTHTYMHERKPTTPLTANCFRSAAAPWPH